MNRKTALAIHALNTPLAKVVFDATCVPTLSLLEMLELTFWFRTWLDENRPTVENARSVLDILPKSPEWDIARFHLLCYLHSSEAG
jgi:hypothetical protein